VLAGEL